MAKAEVTVGRTTDQISTTKRQLLITAATFTVLILALAGCGGAGLHRCINDRRFRAGGDR